MEKAKDIVTQLLKPLQLQQTQVIPIQLMMPVVKASQEKMQRDGQVIVSMRREAGHHNIQLYI